MAAAPEIWRFCASGDSAVASAHFFARYGTDPGAFEQVYWYHSGYCDNEGCLLLLPGGKIEGYYRDSGEDYTHAATAGIWTTKGGAYTVQFTHACVVREPCGSESEPALKPVDPAPGFWTLGSATVTFPCADARPVGLPFLAGNKLVAWSRPYEPGIKVLHGN